MPEHCADGSVVLSAQGLPFSISGVGDLLALYRCVSVRYRFSTDMMKPNLMGAIGRVYSSSEVRMYILRSQASTFDLIMLMCSPRCPTTSRNMISKCICE
jgi:hypothetical protein